MSSKEQKTPEGQAPEEIIMDQHEEIEAVEPEASAEQVDPRDEKIANLEAQLAEAQTRERDGILRVKAEMENLRRRTELDIEKAHKFALEKFINELLPVIDSLDRALEVADALGKGDVLCAGEHIGLLDLVVDDGGGVIGHLAAVRAVGLVAVVLGRVMAGCDHNARVAVVVAGGKAQRGNRHQGLIDADFNAVCGQHLSGCFGKEVALDTAVIADGNGLAAALRLDPVGKALGRLTDNINIHAVGAGADDAAQTSGAELQGHGKAVLNGGIVTLDAFQLGLEVCIVQLGSQPTVIHFFIHR